MSNKFDELTKGLAQSVTRRQALKRFGVGLAGMALACFGLANQALAGNGSCYKKCFKPCYANCLATGHSPGSCTYVCDEGCLYQCNG